MNEHLNLTVEVTQLLDRLNIPYVIGGSVASSFFGEPRSTVDVDIAVSMDLAALEPLVSELQPVFYVPESEARRAVAESDSFNVLHSGLSLKVDLFVLGDNLLDRNQLARRVAIDLPTEPVVSVYVTSPEDQVVRKLDWHRQSHSDRQWRDVVSILRLNSSTLDHKYISTTAEAVDLSPALADAYAAAGGSA